MSARRLVAPLLLALAAVTAAHVVARADGKNREEKLKDDRARVTAAGFWIYDDYDAARKEAQRTDKPMIVALRCIPCEHCVKLDEELVETDPRLQPLLDRFVRVRLIRTNGLDLSTFQFDTDQSSAVFLLRADGTIYGRYGTRSVPRLCPKIIPDVTRLWITPLRGGVPHRRFVGRQDLWARLFGKSCP